MSNAEEESSKIVYSYSIIYDYVGECMYCGMPVLLGHKMFDTSEDAEDPHSNARQDFSEPGILSSCSCLKVAERPPGLFFPGHVKHIEYTQNVLADS